MAGQSFAMGEAFGKGFQFGKRRVSSMTNEEFNATSGPKMFAETTADITAMIPEMKKQMANFTLLQSDIIKELIEYLKQLPSDIVGGLLDSGGGIAPPPPKDDVNYYLRGIPAFITPYIGPSGLLNDVAEIPIDTAKQLLELSNPFDQSNFPIAYNFYLSLFNAVKDYVFSIDPTFIGPAVPPEGITPPEDQPVPIDDTRTGGQSGTAEPTSSQITQFNKYNEELRWSVTFLQARPKDGTDYGAAVNSNINAAIVNIQRVEALMLAMWESLNLVAKVNDSWYGVITTYLPHTFQILG